MRFAAQWPCPLHSARFGVPPVLAMRVRCIGPDFPAHRLDDPVEQRKEKIMNTSNNDRPLYRVTFSRITGKDDNGQDVLSRPKEIGAAWARKGDKQGAIISLDIIPTDLVNRNGVLFLLPVQNENKGGSQ